MRTVQKIYLTFKYFTSFWICQYSDGKSAFASWRWSGGSSSSSLSEELSLTISSILSAFLLRTITTTAYNKYTHATAWTWLYCYYFRNIYIYDENSQKIKNRGELPQLYKECIQKPILSSHLMVQDWKLSPQDLE